MVTTWGPGPKEIPVKPVSEFILGVDRQRPYVPCRRAVVRFGSFASFWRCAGSFRSTPMSGQFQCQSSLRIRARSGTGPAGLGNMNPDRDRYVANKPSRVIPPLSSRGRVEHDQRPHPHERGELDTEEGEAHGNGSVRAGSEMRARLHDPGGDHPHRRQAWVNAHPPPVRRARSRQTPAGSRRSWRGRARRAGKTANRAAHRPGSS